MNTLDDNKLDALAEAVIAIHDDVEAIGSSEVKAAYRALMFAVGQILAERLGPISDGN